MSPPKGEKNQPGVLTPNHSSNTVESEADGLKAQVHLRYAGRFFFCLKKKPAEAIAKVAVI